MIKKIVLTGPESVGKSLLVKQLGDYYSAPCVFEIAREYLNIHGNSYTQNDVIEIAKLQIQVEKDLINQDHKIIFLDTDLIVTKIWLQHCYGDYPKWIDEYIFAHLADLHLLCYPDLPWIDDPLRENPKLRMYFFEKYRQEIKSFNMNYEIIKGFGEERFYNAFNAVEKNYRGTLVI
ncbi:MAG: ATP-binding protein [Bacteroidales bacterium]|jgi:NadR type nicotinamide-nucleotide adenylyltransferase|nr:ATP-binding protein [Bacteroidales bacterium]